MNEKLKEKIREALASVLPITGIVLLLSVSFVPMEIGTFMMFMTGALLLIVGMGFFQLGAEMAMTPLGQGVGAQMMKHKKVTLSILVAFLMGTLITIAEPDLQVLSNQVEAIPNRVLIYTVAVGVGVFAAIAVVRVLYSLNLAKMLTVFYSLLFLLTLFTPREFLAVAFDAGGVTTGPVTVPFIMAMGVGLSAARSDSSSGSDSFGLVALCSIGPILTVLLLGMVYHPSEALYTTVEIAPVSTVREMWEVFAKAIPGYAREVLMSMIPILGVFVLFQLLTHRYQHRQMLRMQVGFLYTFIGLVLFLTGVNVGFAPVGNLLGHTLAGGQYKWLLIPIALLIGFFIVKAEPAVQVLNNQVEEISGGTISHKAMNATLSIGVASAVALSMVRVLTGLSLYWILIPGYVIALILTHFVSPIFVGIAFDSGGVASGPMTSTFLLPLAIGACTAVGGNVVTDAFGIVALVAMVPLIAVQVMGLITTIREKRKPVSADTAQKFSDDIVVAIEEDSNDGTV